MPHHHHPADVGSPEFVSKLSLAIAFVLLGGLFSGLTLGLMSLDETHLRITARSVDSPPRTRHRAIRLLDLLHGRKHWILITLLLANVIVNESLPILLDHVLGSGLHAILLSTSLIVLFGEILPTAVCSRHALAIGAASAPGVRALLYLLAPVSYPLSRFFDWWLGTPAGGVQYRKSELKELVRMHHHAPFGVLDADEAAMLGAALDMKDKAVRGAMTPFDQVFFLDSAQVVDRELLDTMLRHGYSRVPVRQGQDAFAGMLLVKRLLGYDPSALQPVASFQLESLPEVPEHMNLLDAISLFQNGQSHMALVASSSVSGDADGVKYLGIITLEDVIRELIGKKIVDEADICIDVHCKVSMRRKRMSLPIVSSQYSGDARPSREQRAMAADEAISCPPSYLDETSRLIG